MPNDIITSHVACAHVRTKQSTAYPFAPTLFLQCSNVIPNIKGHIIHFSCITHYVMRLEFIISSKFMSSFRLVACGNL